MQLNEIWSLAKEAVGSWSEDYAPSMGAALAYYTVFSIAPLLLIVIAVAGLVFGEEAARGEIFEQLSGLMGKEGAIALQGLLESFRRTGTGVLATAVSIVVLLVGATTVFAELQDALDRIWRAPARDKTGGLWGLVRARLLSFGMILGIGFLLIVSLVASAALAALGRWWGERLGGWQVLASVLNLLVSYGLITVLFAMIYKMMPRVKIAWHDVWIGAAVTSLLFAVGKFLIGQYIGHSGIASGFGAAASLIVVLVWVYYSAQIFLLGAEFTWVYAHRHGSLKGRPRPAPATPTPTRTAPLEGPAAAAGPTASRRGRTVP
ncbi:YihY/virulence factor BrkB family protein [Caldimonas tepidiphila]|uniref:YihY/virulence factor BrkB family protein n=1 Tax=Caldimonas tepidiphila TaxID=2315841 RepID=UPI000E5B2328|nr:YihY/virulence factor BrkB family protein [Caldimonas tepidiphila]